MKEARAFWSIHADCLSTFSVIPNPINCYSIGSGSKGLRFNADGPIKPKALLLGSNGREPKSLKPANAIAIAETSAILGEMGRTVCPTRWLEAGSGNRIGSDRDKESRHSWP